MATITIRIIGGTPNYHVELIPDIGTTWNFGVQGIYILTGVPAGSYQVRVTDSNGCVETSPGDIVVTTTTSTTSTTTTTEEPVTTTTEELATTTTEEIVTTTTELATTTTTCESPILPEFQRFCNNPILEPTESWEGINIADCCVIEDDTELKMYYSGFATIISNGIGLATSELIDPPVNWTKQGRILAPDTVPGQWDSGWVRLGSVLKLGSTFYMYYEGSPDLDEEGTDQIGLATSSDGITFSRHPSNPLLTISGDETNIEDPSVIRIDATHWYMYYSYRTAGAILPGIRLATSSDGISWTKQGEMFSIGDLGSFDDTYIEHCQAYCIGCNIVIIYEAYDGTNWSHGMAYSSNPEGPFIKYVDNPFFTRSGVGGAFDELHVATPTFFFMNSNWYLFYQGGENVIYQFSNWKIGIACNYTCCVSSTTTTTEEPVIGTTSTTTTTYVPGINLKNDLISIWEFDETQGTTAFDSYGNNDATLDGTLVNQTGILNKCVYTDGSNDTITISNNITGYSNGISISCWYKNMSSSKHVFILSKRTVSQVDCFQFYRNYTTNNFYFHIGSNSKLLGNMGGDIDAWYHVVLTYDKQNIRIYIDGELINTVEDTDDIPETDVDSFIGYGGDGSIYCNSYYDQTAVWGRALNEDEVAALYNNGNGLAYVDWEPVETTTTTTEEPVTTTSTETTTTTTATP